MIYHSRTLHVGMVCSHDNGNVYTIVQFTVDETDTVTAHYVGANGRIWKKDAIAFRTSMTIIFDGTNRHVFK